MEAYGLRELVRLALDEDGIAGDPTSEAVIPADQEGTGLLLAREPLVVSGLAAAQAVFRAADADADFEAAARDGDRCEAGAVVARAFGPLRSLLRAERPALNFVQRLSGIATWTARHVAAVRGTGCRVADTRKTTPGWRALEKAAVRAGGGVNHRFHLGDGVLLKDNHLLAAGGVAGAVAACRAEAHHLLAVEVECDTLDEVRDALAAGVDAILLDNMTPAKCAEALEVCAGRVFVEASGGIGLDNIAAYAACGVDQVALGALTHSAPAADLAFDLLQEGA